MLIYVTVCASFAPPPRRVRRADHPRCCDANLYDERLPEWLTARAAALGFAAPTAIQAAAHPTLLDGADAILLGSFDLAGISPAVSGKAQVVVTLGLSADGVLHVTAVDRSTDRARQIEIRDRMPTPMSTMTKAA